MKNNYAETLNIITECETVQVSAWIDVIGDTYEDSGLLSITFDPFKLNNGYDHWDVSQYVSQLKSPDPDQIEDMTNALIRAGVVENEVDHYIEDIKHMINQIENTCYIIRKARQAHMKSSKLISAEEAKELTRKVTDVELEMVNQEIKEAADKGRRKCYIYTGLERETIDAIKEAGYEIHANRPVGIQKLYYTISWYNN